jgi:hypothetical protein
MSGAPLNNFESHQLPATATRLHVERGRVGLMRSGCSFLKYLNGRFARCAEMLCPFDEPTPWALDMVARRRAQPSLQEASYIELNSDSRGKCPAPLT